ncbi:GNAT family N-acetyltransferase [Conexibacter sp. CPCC 206217]|uniref:GNAT family N-acetyltransferase n=1 Tax=Conexibacter sp. CPCC 206217 TaxID=3064574 RepID=UPI0027221BAE|nr:GNAT family N-acetyltransferase [Conexibacter sp. CPCC 206217]MDO8212746.1 GNAT family N-acetyltransferase [Conexibacter sp. CPCC 206217]
MARLPALDPAPADGVVALRRWVPADVPAIAAACRDPEIQRWTFVPDDYDALKARAFVAASSTRWWAGSGADVAIVDAVQPERVLGSVGLVRIEWERACGEVGYWVAPGERRRGVAARAVALLSAWAFERLALTRLELIPFVGNEASQRVAERAGYVREPGPPFVFAADTKHGPVEGVLFARTAL